MRKLIVALGMTTAVCLTSAAVAFADGAPPPVQAATQSATTSQQAAALSSAQQVQPSNVNVSIRINSPGDDGNVTQTNSVGSTANAGNSASTGQTADQSQGGSGVQASQQAAGTGQGALALSGAQQYWPSNLNVPTRVWSHGDGGSTSQSNTAGSTANAGNNAETEQGSTQTQGSSCGCGGSAGGVQAADQSAGTQQTAVAASKAVQVDPSNQNVSVRINSPGDDGNVTQTNAVTSNANAGNTASTEQQASQGNAGESCGCNAVPTAQAWQPQATTDPSAATQPQATTDPSAATQPQATADPSAATQPQATSQNGSSDPSTDSAVAPASSPAPSVQAIGQDASTQQTAIAGSAAVQSGASNVADPVRIDSWGDNGNVSQANTVSSTANAGNSASTEQNAGQTAGGSKCGCGGSDIQAIGQQAETGQGALALSGAIQQFGGGEPSRCGCGGSDGGSGNTASPVRVWSPGTDGNVTQNNSVDSTANAGNNAQTTQDATQQSGGGSGLQIQAIGQEAGTWQAAAAGSFAAQLGASNNASPVRVWSPGGGGSVTQSNGASSTANAGNDAGTTQTATQAMGGSRCGCHTLPIQAIGQKAELDQLALAGSAAFQFFPKNDASPVRIGSWGDGGSVGQENTDGSLANGGNLGETDQSASQLT
jgi:hypothetical protein